MRLLKQVQLLQLNPASLLFPAVTAASVSGASGAVNAAAKTATTAAEVRLTMVLDGSDLNLSVCCC